MQFSPWQRAAKDKWNRGQDERGRARSPWHQESETQILSKAKSGMHEQTRVWESLFVGIWLECIIGRSSGSLSLDWGWILREESTLWCGSAILMKRHSGAFDVPISKIKGRQSSLKTVLELVSSPGYADSILLRMCKGHLLQVFLRQSLLEISFPIF